MMSLFSPFLKSGFYSFKTSRSLRQSKFSLASVFICGSRDHEARKLSEAREGGSDNVVLILGATAAVMLRYGSPKKNIALKKN